MPASPDGFRELDNSSFEARQKATSELEKAGDLAEGIASESADRCNILGIAPPARGLVLAIKQRPLLPTRLAIVPWTFYERVGTPRGPSTTQSLAKASGSTGDQGSESEFEQIGKAKQEVRLEGYWRGLGTFFIVASKKILMAIDLAGGQRDSWPNSARLGRESIVRRIGDSFDWRQPNAEIEISSAGPRPAAIRYFVRFV